MRAYNTMFPPDPREVLSRSQTGNGGSERRSVKKPRMGTTSGGYLEPDAARKLSSLNCTLEFVLSSGK